MTSPVSNLLLSSLSPAYRHSLIARLKPVSLRLKEMLYDNDGPPKFGHFLTSGMASVVSTMANGSTTEVGIWGKEGMPQSFHLLGNAKVPTCCFMQVAGTALQIPFKELQKEFQEVPEFRECVLQGIQSHGFILSQLAACNRLHEADERLARWLLMVRDRVGSDSFYLTQDFLATMLGSRRTTVTAAASALQRRGIIKYSRGRMNILDAKSLEEAACECYPTIRNLYQDFFSANLVA